MSYEDDLKVADDIHARHEALMEENINYVPFDVDALPFEGRAPEYKKDTDQIPNEEIGLKFLPASEIKMEQYAWLWKDMLCRGKISIIAGQPDMGKSQITISLAAIVSSGMPWPDEPAQSSGTRDIQNVIIFSSEDDAGDTIVPRLKAAGADMDHVFVYDKFKKKGKDGKSVDAHFNIADDLPALKEAIAKVSNVGLIIIDPISSYMGAVDSHNNSEVRGAISPLGELASDIKASIVLLNHFNKNTTEKNAVTRVTGSIAFAAIARAMFVVMNAPEDERQSPEEKWFLPAKNNISKHKKGFAYTIESVMVDGVYDMSRIRWGREITTSASDALAKEGKKSPENKEAAATAWLQFLLMGKVDGMPVTDILDSAKAHGHSRTNVYLAKEELSIESVDGADRRSKVWRYPMMTE
jgi:putative DNA primase/helicase